LKTIPLESLDDVAVFAADIVKTLKSGDIFLMDGDLGAGKTTFVRTLCKQLDILDVSSPTFNIINRYDAKPFTVFHMDLYRCESEESIDLLDLDDIFSRPQSVFFVEWASRLGSFMPERYTKMEWELGEGEQRVVRLSDWGSKPRLA
jgi:tRNA threonylcarbamoyladenosine biosynthesis protein TsaE